VLSGRGFCDELITRPEESYRLWCVVVCDLENLKNGEAMTRVGSQRHKKRKTYVYIHLSRLCDPERYRPDEAYEVCLVGRCGIHIPYGI